MVIYMEKHWSNPLLIQDGHVTLEDHDIGVKYVIPVKQVKGLGTADADSLIDINDYHKQILQTLITTDENSTFTANQILQWVEVWRARNHIAGEFKQANWRRPISEFVRKGILYKVSLDKGPPRYSLDHTRAKHCLETRRFEP